MPHRPTARATMSGYRADDIVSLEARSVIHGGPEPYGEGPLGPTNSTRCSDRHACAPFWNIFRRLMTLVNRRKSAIRCENCCFWWWPASIADCEVSKRRADWPGGTRRCSRPYSTLNLVNLDSLPWPHGIQN